MLQITCMITTANLYPLIKPLLFTANMKVTFEMCASKNEVRILFKYWRKKLFANNLVCTWRYLNDVSGYVLNIQKPRCSATHNAPRWCISRYLAAFKCWMMDNLMDKGNRVLFSSAKQFYTFIAWLIVNLIKCILTTGKGSVWMRNSESTLRKR